MHPAIWTNGRLALFFQIDLSRKYFTTAHETRHIMTAYREQVSASEQAFDRSINIAAGCLQRLHISFPIKEALQPCTNKHSAGANPYGQRDSHNTLHCLL